jgi:hypothetical protein
VHCVTARKYALPTLRAPHGPLRIYIMELIVTSLLAALSLLLGHLAVLVRNRVRASLSAAA